jgi:hypothetical protein
MGLEQTRLHIGTRMDVDLGMGLGLGWNGKA